MQSLSHEPSVIKCWNEKHPKFFQKLSKKQPQEEKSLLLLENFSQRIEKYLNLEISA